MTDDEAKAQNEQLVPQMLQEDALATYDELRRTGELKPDEVLDVILRYFGGKND